MIARSTLISVFALAAAASMAQEGSYLRSFLTPVQRGPSFGGMRILGNEPQRLLLVQPGTAWGSGFSSMGATFAFINAPNGANDKGTTVYAFSHGKTWPEDESDISTSLMSLAHQYQSSDDDFWSEATAYYMTQNGMGDLYGGNFTVYTKVRLIEADGHFVLGASANYAQLSPISDDMSRGAAFSVNVARRIGPNLSMQYDHTFASKFAGQKTWFMRTTYFPDPTSQVRLTVGSGEVYSLEYGFFFGAK